MHGAQEERVAKRRFCPTLSIFKGLKLIEVSGRILLSQLPLGGLFELAHQNTIPLRYVACISNM